MKKMNLALTVLSILGLASCGSNSNGKIRVTIGFWPQTQERQDIAMYLEWEKAFEADYPQYDIVGQNYIYNKDTILSDATAHTLPTIFQTWFTEPDMLVSKNYIRECDTILESLGWKEQMAPEMRDVLTKNGKLYGVPRDAYGLGLLINKRKLAEHDLLPEIDGKPSIYNEDGTPAYPQTFEDIYEWSQVIAENEVSAKGILILNANKNGGWQFTNFAWNYGATIESFNEAENKWEANLTSKACVDAMSWIKRMASEDLLLESANVVYDDWYSKIGEQVAMAFVGSDVLFNAQLLGDVPMDDLAFVPMPTGDGVHHYSLYGGTPYVFPKYATDEQVEGAIRFLEYCGRSPVASDIARNAMVKGHETAKAKTQPILPTIKPWINPDYLTMVNDLEEEYVDVNMNDYKNFYDNIMTNKHSEEPYYAQELYEILDDCIQSILEDPFTANVETLLATAESKFNKNYMSKVK